MSSSSNSQMIASTRQVGDDIIIRLCIAILLDNTGDDQPRMRMLTLSDERLPVPLGNLRTFANLRRTLRLVLFSTMSHYGVQSTQMSHGAVVLPIGQHSQNNGLLGITDNEDIWQNYMSRISSSYHKPCTSPETCSTCCEPAIVVACFPAPAFEEDPGQNFVMHDRLSSEHVNTLRKISTIEEERYRRIVQRSNRDSAIGETTLNSTPATLSSQPALLRGSSNAQTFSLDPTKGPKGRSLLGCEKQDTKEKDYSKGTPRPAEADQGKKAESDTCLTCIRYNRRCRGVTMTYVRTQRNGRQPQWKCAQCCNPQRRCLWRPSATKVTTYSEAFKADGGQELEKNTVEGRKARAQERMKATVERDEDGSDDEENEGGEEDDEE